MLLSRAVPNGHPSELSLGLARNPQQEMPDLMIMTGCVCCLVSDLRKRITTATQHRHVAYVDSVRTKSDITPEEPMDPHNLGILEVARALQLHPIQHGLSSYQYGAVPILKPRLLCPRKKWWPPDDRDIYLCKIYPQFDYPLATVFACLAAVFGGQCAIYVPCIN